MGTLNIYKCKSCGYTAEVSGGKDRGFFIATQTRLCSECKELVDVVTGVIKGEVNVMPRHQAKVEKSIGRCPECGGMKLKAWTPRVCPKCKGKITQEGASCMWD